MHPVLRFGSAHLCRVGHLRSMRPVHCLRRTCALRPHSCAPTCEEADGRGHARSLANQVPVRHARGVLSRGHTRAALSPRQPAVLHAHSRGHARMHAHARAGTHAHTTRAVASPRQHALRSCDLISIHISIGMSTPMCIHMRQTHMSMHVNSCLYMYLDACTHVDMSMDLPIHKSSRMSVHMSIHMLCRCSMRLSALGSCAMAACDIRNTWINGSTEGGTRRRTDVGDG